MFQQEVRGIQINSTAERVAFIIALIGSINAIIIMGGDGIKREARLSEDVWVCPREAVIQAKETRNDFILKFLKVREQKKNSV